MDGWRHDPFLAPRTLSTRSLFFSVLGFFVPSKSVCNFWWYVVSLLFSRLIQFLNLTGDCCFFTGIFAKNPRIFSAKISAQMLAWSVCFLWLKWRRVFGENSQGFRRKLLLDRDSGFLLSFSAKTQGYFRRKYMCKWSRSFFDLSDLSDLFMCDSSVFQCLRHVLGYLFDGKNLC